MRELLKVSQMPPDLQAACRERGFSPDDEMPPREAVAEWSAWHLGDKVWAYTILDLYDEAK